MGTCVECTKPVGSDVDGSGVGLPVGDSVGGNVGLFVGSTEGGDVGEVDGGGVAGTDVSFTFGLEVGA